MQFGWIFIYQTCCFTFNDESPVIHCCSVHVCFVYTLCVVYLLLSRLLLFDYCTNRVYYIMTSVHVWLRHTACVCGTSCNENKIRCKSYERL